MSLRYTCRPVATSFRPTEPRRTCRGKRQLLTYIFITLLLPFTSPYLTNSKHQFRGTRGIGSSLLYALKDGAPLGVAGPGRSPGQERRDTELGTPASDREQQLRVIWLDGALPVRSGFTVLPAPMRWLKSITHSRAAGFSGFDLSFEGCWFWKRIQMTFPIRVSLSWLSVLQEIDLSFSPIPHISLGVIICFFISEIN